MQSPPVRLYVGNLAFETTDAELTALFSAFGTVAHAAVVTDRETGRSRGFAFVEMETAEQARAALAGLDEKPWQGRALQVTVAHPREDRGARRQS